MLAELSGLHGDKAIWRLLHSGRCEVAEVPVEGAVPADVDTWHDYEAPVADDPYRTQG
jgi:molybdenum cofactor cytidylyltransferase